MDQPILLALVVGKKIRVSSDRWNWLSKNRVKFKVVEVDWDNDGFNLDTRGNSINLNTMANDSAANRDVVALIVSEIKDRQGGTLEWVLDSKYLYHFSSSVLRNARKIQKARFHYYGRK